jgi:hypothetical protein
MDHSSPPKDRVTGRLSLLHTADTDREQFGYRYTETACKERIVLYGAWNKIDIMDGFFPFSLPAYLSH